MRNQVINPVKKRKYTKKTLLAHVVAAHCHLAPLLPHAASARCYGALLLHVTTAHYYRMLRLQDVTARCYCSLFLPPQLHAAIARCYLALLLHDSFSIHAMYDVVSSSVCFIPKISFMLFGNFNTAILAPHFNTRIWCNCSL